MHAPISRLFADHQNASRALRDTRGRGLHPTGSRQGLVSGDCASNGSRDWVIIVVSDYSMARAHVPIRPCELPVHWVIRIAPIASAFNGWGKVDAEVVSSFWGVRSYP